MDTLLHVGLGDRIQSGALKQVDEQTGLDAVAAEEGTLFEQHSPSAVLAGERLDHPRELGEEQIQARTRRDLRPAPAARRLHLLADVDGSLIERLHILQARMDQQRTNDAVHELRVDVADVRVDPADDVATQHEQALPQRLAFAGERPELGHELLMHVHRHALALRDLARAVVRAGVDDDDLVDEWIAAHQPLAHRVYDVADGLLFVQRRETDRDRQALAALEIDEPLEVSELR